MPKDTKDISAPATAREYLNSIAIGVVLNLQDGKPRVVFPGNRSDTAVPAISTIALERDDIGTEVALAFENGDPGKPVILGKILHPEEPGEVTELVEVPDPAGAEIEADGKRVELEAEEQIVLRCGKASITMTRAGKIVLRGTYISSRSSGMNRVSGASVNLN